jgi:ribosomal peptide maturation radical SAM protein 1
MWRDAQGQVRYAGRAPNFHAMNETPVPDFDEFYYARKASGYESWHRARSVQLPLETSRGCWWGEKNHCTFCGLNRSGMEFRAKSVDNVVQQLEALSSRYCCFNFFAIDNIMAPEYTEKLFGRLAAANSDISIHYEIRPNFSRTQLARMQRGGLHSVLPGVESFSTNILKSMRKFTTGMRNIELVKWCTHYRMNITYNILCRFPGETEGDYREQCEVIAKIPHFQPPYAAVMARADRGSRVLSQIALDPRGSPARTARDPARRRPRRTDCRCLARACGAGQRARAARRRRTRRDPEDSFEGRGLRARPAHH